MGRTHAATGLLAGMALAPALGLGTVHQAVVFAATTAGFALLPDLDHPSASATRLFGWLTGAVSWLLRRASAIVYAATKGPRDENVEGTHRHLSHTLLFAVGLGASVAAGCAAGGTWAVLAVLAVGLLLAVGVLGDWLLLAYAAAAAWWYFTASGGIEAQLADISGWLGVAVAIGCVVHCLGDSLTESGCPFLFPLPIAGETWYELRPPKPLRLHTGKKVETRLVFPVVIALCVLTAPGVRDHLVEIVRATAATTAGAPR
ncbi:metal-dependent hydrolase (plasmid) [Amycolatopsis sp. FU40]|uniref:metal-dependent hydrolase n=1 Tax=Amycolatopsis sp. FU40 TaxID=2914159 RepID=UPI001F321A6A|nr:metal-dependent hydrolase [Amycolatopsis sp. FU40]UKD50885.1 metal-dependent hydrolase [Amycolatopsis sp. FU40]